MGPSRARFSEVEHPIHQGQTLKRMITYFIHEKAMVLVMLLVVIFGTICGVVAPSLQSHAIDILAGSVLGNFIGTLILMLIIYLLYGISQFMQGILSAKLSQRIVKKMREELFDKIIDLPISYLDTHSHGDVMSRMTNDIENISTTVLQSLPSLFSGVLTIIATVSIMMYYCLPLAMLSCTTVIFTVIATKVLSSKVRQFSRRR